MSSPSTILKIDSSARRHGSTTRDLSNEIARSLAAEGNAHIITRDVAGGLR